MHAAVERLACYRYFGAQLPPDGGKQRLTPQVAAKRQQRTRVIKPSILHLAYDPRSSAVAQAVEKGKYDLVVVGAENRAIQHRLFFGYENERLIRATRVPVVVVVPNLRRLAVSVA